MPRVKRGPKRAHKRKKVLKLSSGFYGTKSNAYRMAMQAVDQAGKFATRDRAPEEARSSARSGSSASTPPRTSTASPTTASSRA